VCLGVVESRVNVYLCGRYFEIKWRFSSSAANVNYSAGHLNGTFKLTFII
jgi:hypothetical protein